MKLTNLPLIMYCPQCQQHATIIAYFHINDKQITFYSCEGMHVLWKPDTQLTLIEANMVHDLIEVLRNFLVEQNVKTGG